ncbi:alpha-ribazole phosphatase [Flavobacterium humi]|uniref:Alpha-ribazole phosphatase n=1 Tax=Flavobacterium humi TaxID=2562683 RepID=A0A4Z0L4R4_9FLAO|nr:alpha-ribazole phosphatase [Flavobacterium humi]TGD56691.1 alpha-ribazole phosphatase [Flavobacterium humi]
MEIYLVRHTETVCEKGICYGQSDVGLREDYRQLFADIKAQLPSNAVYYSSPLQRCTLLADYLSGSNYSTDARLMEMHFGDWELQKWDLIAPEELNPWMEDFVNVPVPNGESFVDLHARVLDFIETELQNRSQPIVIVTHAGVIRSLLCKITNLPLAEAFTNKVDFGQVIRVEVN